MVAYPAKPADPHEFLAGELGITRNEAKYVNLAMNFHSASLCIHRGAAVSLIRCHEIARIYPEPFGAAKSAKWEWLTQNQPFDEMVAINAIRKFLPETRDLNTMHPLMRHLRLKDRLTLARGIATNATSEAQLVKIEELLRPFAFILEKEGHRVYE
ncbi:hypothetical protein vBCbaSRXM_54 [Citromicrobium phage vB_CbaS-RXM]|nr:hypothetical protein vBCbaSRXM_54 [Citromicrobium phage vB_CbaS-RXM]